MISVKFNEFHCKWFGQLHKLQKINYQGWGVFDSLEPEPEPIEEKKQEQEPEPEPEPLKN